MKNIAYILISIFIFNCSSTSPDISQQEEELRKKKQATSEKSKKLAEKFEEKIEEEEFIPQKSTAKLEILVQISDSAKGKEREIINNPEIYYFGECEGDDYETAKEKTKTEIIEKIILFIISEKELSISNVDYRSKSSFKSISSSHSMMKLYNLKKLDVKPKRGGKYRIISYITVEDLKKSNEQTEKEISGLLKEAENLEILNNNIYDAVQQYYKAFLKSQTSIFEIKYNSNTLGEVSAKNFAEQKVRKYLDEIILKSESIKYIESDDQFEITLRLDYKGKVLNNIKVKTESGDFRRVASNKVKLFEVYQDLSQLEININCLISPFIEFTENDFLKLIEDDFGVIANKTIVADFSSFIKIDFKCESVNQNAFKFTPDINGIPPNNFSWSFSDGTKSTDQNPLKILPQNFTGLTITFILNDNENYKVIKELTKNNIIITKEKAKISTKPTPPLVADDPPKKGPEKPVPSGAEKIPPKVKTDEAFEKELNSAKNANEWLTIIDDLKDKDFLVYSTNPKNFPNIESCYLIVIVGKNNLQILKPGTQYRNSIKGKVVDIETVSKILYYIKII